MATLKGAYQRFVTSLIRLWKGQEAEDSQSKDTEQATSEVDDARKTEKDPEPSTSGTNGFNTESVTEHTVLELRQEAPNSSSERPTTLRLQDEIPNLGSNFEGESRIRAASDHTDSSSPESPNFLQVTRVSRNLSDTNLNSLAPNYQTRNSSAPVLHRGLSTTNLRSSPASSSRRPFQKYLRRELTSSDLRDSSKSPPHNRQAKKQRPKSVSDFLTPEPKTDKSKLKRSPTFRKLSPSVFRRNQFKGNTDSPDKGSKHSGVQRIPTLALSTRFSLASISKKIDGTLKRRPKTKRKAMEEIDIGRDKKMPAESFMARLRDYNMYYEDRGALQFKWKQDKSGNLLVDGMLNIYWGLKRSIRLQMADTGVKIRPKSQFGIESDAIKRFDDTLTSSPITEEDADLLPTEQTLTGTILRKKIDRAKETMLNDGGEVSINIENGILGDTRHRSYDRRRMALRLKNGGERVHVPQEDPQNGLIRQKSVILRKRHSSKAGIKRFSINGHAYNYETSVFTPAYGSVTNVRATSKTSCEDVIKHLLNKFRVENSPDEFSLFVVKETEERRELSRNEYPLVTRILSGPNEEVCKIFVMDRHMHDDISSEVAQYIKLDLNILQMFVQKFTEEEEREATKMKERYAMYRKMLTKQIEECKENAG